MDEVAILTVDGVGEWATTTWGVGKGNKIDLKKDCFHSLVCYTLPSRTLGFKVNLQNTKSWDCPYGEPKYVDRIKQLITIKDDGTFRPTRSTFHLTMVLMYGPSLKGNKS